jgi:hypothetical protein
MNWTLSVISICTVLAIALSWQEFVRPYRKRLGLRVLAIWLSLAALACIALPVHYIGQVPVSDQSEAILLTEGFNKDSVSGNAPVFTTSSAIQKTYAKAKLIGSIQELTDRKPVIKQVKVLGYGLTGDELEQLGDLPITYTAPEPPAGIQSVNWPGNLKTGNAFTIQGTYKNVESKSIKVLLKGLNTHLDSVTLPANKSTPFQLSTIPRLTGRAVYQLLALSGTDTLLADNVPVQIEPAKPVKVLMLNASPDFETRFLKNWLVQNGYAVATRAAISKNKISEEYVNVDKLNLQHISANVLNQFDVLIGDLSALKSLSSAEEAALRQQVTKKGLGLIIRADSSSKAVSWLQRDFPVNIISTPDQVSVALIMQSQKEKTAKLNIDPSYISYRNNTQSLVTDTKNHELAGTALAGAGKITFTTLNHTYTWLLNGNKQDYASLWTLLINKSARKTLPVQTWKVGSDLPTVNGFVKLILQSTTQPELIRINGENIAPIQNATVPYEWISTYFPEKQGWQTANTNNDTPFWWYNGAKNDWKSIQLLKKITESQTFAKKQAKKATVTKQIQQTIKIEIPKIWFYLILLSSCTFLWTERKFIN